ncbi:hypothetical protein FB451DRAFT_1177097 [Mycena latifolia]|nr:hypothetical protein FB451DRAFT_1177097 [Mycena latifolia]
MASHDAKKELLEPPQPLDLDAPPGDHGMVVDSQDVVDWTVDDEDADAKVAHDEVVAGGEADEKPASTPKPKGKVTVKSLRSELEQVLSASKKLRSENEDLRVEVRVAAKLLETSQREATKVVELEKSVATLSECLAWQTSKTAAVQEDLAAAFDRIDNLKRIADDYAEEVERLRGRLTVSDETRQYDEERERKRSRRNGGDAPNLVGSGVEGESGSSLTVSGDDPLNPDAVMSDVGPAEASTEEPGRFEPVTEERQEELKALFKASHLSSGITRMPPRNEPLTLDSIGYDVPPLPILNDERYACDERGYPVTQIAMERLLMIVQDKPSQHFWVPHFRLWVIWLYARGVPENDRTIVHKMAIQHFRMLDWFSDTLSYLGRHSQQCHAEIRRYDRLNQSDMPYDPVLFASWLQYREITRKGCGFVDDCFTLNMRLVRGCNLFDVLTLERRTSDSKRHAIIEVLVMPDLYATHTDDMSWMISDVFAPQQWALESAKNATVDLAIESMAAMGVPVEYVDDAWAFAYHWLQDMAALEMPPVGWQNGEAQALLDSVETYVADPPRGLEEADALFPRHPMLPWKTRFERIAHFEVSEWRHPLTKGLKLQDNSRIQSLLDRGFGVSKDPQKWDRLNRQLLIADNPYLARKAAAPLPPKGVKPTSGSAQAESPAPAKPTLPAPPLMVTTPPVVSTAPISTHNPTTPTVNLKGAAGTEHEDIELPYDDPNEPNAPA